MSNTPRPLMFCGRHHRDMLTFHDKTSVIVRAPATDFKDLIGSDQWTEILIASGEEETFHRICRDFEINARVPYRVVTDHEVQSYNPIRDGLCVVNYAGRSSVSLISWFTEPDA